MLESMFFKFVYFVLGMLGTKLFKKVENKLRTKASDYFEKAKEYKNFYMTLPDRAKYEEAMNTHFKNLELYFEFFCKWHIKPDIDLDVKRIVEARGFKYSEGVQGSDIHTHYLQIFKKFEAYCNSINGEIFNKVQIIELENKAKKDEIERKHRENAFRNTLDCL
jgi:hypothetical protein